MTEKELIEAAKKALEKESKISPELRWKRLVWSGLIDKQGKVILGKKHPCSNG